MNGSVLWVSSYIHSRLFLNAFDIWFFRNEVNSQAVQPWIPVLRRIDREFLLVQ